MLSIFEMIESSDLCACQKGVVREFWDLGWGYRIGDLSYPHTYTNRHTHTHTTQTHTHNELTHTHTRAGETPFEVVCLLVFRLRKNILRLFASRLIKRLSISFDARRVYYLYG